MAHTDRAALALSHRSMFRIGYTAYMTWTTAGFYVEALAEQARDRFPDAPESAYTRSLVSLDAYAAEQKRRGQGAHGAMPQAAVLCGDRAEGARRAAEFHALPALSIGDVVLLDGAPMIVSRHHNEHIRFVPAAS